MTASRGASPSPAGSRRRRRASSAKPSFLGIAALASFAGSTRISTRSTPQIVEGDPRQGSGRLGRKTRPYPALADPVADLQRIRADPRVQSRSADDLGFVGGEDPVDEVLAEVELASEGSQELHLLCQRLRLVVCPRHPRAQMVEARVDCVLQERRVARLPAAQDETLGDDPVRRIVQNASRRRTASSTRATDGMYSSSSCQYGYGTS